MDCLTYYLFLSYCNKKRYKCRYMQEIFFFTVCLGRIPFFPPNFFHFQWRCPGGTRGPEVLHTRNFVKLFLLCLIAEKPEIRYGEEYLSKVVISRISELPLCLRHCIHKHLYLYACVMHAHEYRRIHEHTSSNARRNNAVNLVAFFSFIISSRIPVQYFLLYFMTNTPRLNKTKITIQTFWKIFWIKQKAS